MFRENLVVEERITADYRESIDSKEHYMELVCNCLKCKVGNLAINHVNLMFDEQREDIARELKDIAVNGKEFTSDEFSSWIERVGAAKCLNVYLMIKDEVRGWEPKASIKNHPDKEEGILKIHFKHGKQKEDFVENFNIRDKKAITKLYEVLQVDSREEAERIWNT